MIKLSDIQTITDHCIRLLSTTEKLRGMDATNAAFSKAEMLYPSLRKLFVATIMQDKQLICISGLQGAGKTTLMKNFYGINEEFMNVSLGRGERVPVLITETNVPVPCIFAVKIDKDETGTYSKKEVVLSNDEIIRATKGEDEKIMYLEIKVPYKHTYNENVSFMLLPGFEKKNEYWNNLIEFAVNSSDAAVFVFNETSFSEIDNEQYLNRIESRFGKNVVYAISNSDTSFDDNAQVKQTCIDVLKVDEPDRVVCVGQYNDEEKNNRWIAAFKSAIDKYALFQTSSTKKTDEYIYNELLDLKSTLYSILSVLNEGDDMEMVDYKNHQLLKVFDGVVKKKKAELTRHLNDEFTIAKGASGDIIVEKLVAKPWYKKLKRTFWGTSVKELYVETKELINGSLEKDGKCLPDFHLGKALRASLRSLDTPTDNNPNAIQLLVDTTEKDGNIVLSETEDTKNALEDVKSLIQVPSKNAERHTIQNPNPNATLKAVAEVATYYYGLTSYNNLAEKTVALASYVPAESHLKAKDVIDGADSSKKFAIGLAGVMGVDVLADGSLNLIGQIASTCSLALPYAAAASVLIVGIGAATAIIKDVNKMLIADKESAQMAINGIYDKIQQETLERFDYYMDEVRSRIEDNLIELNGNRKAIVNNYNAKVSVNNLIDFLDNLTEDYLKQSHNVESHF